MATSASQTYIAKLGFQDKDRGNNRHGVACEYLFERLLELEVIPCKLELLKEEIQSDIEFRELELSKSFYDNEKVTKIAKEILKLETTLNTLSIDFAASHIAEKLRVGECVNVPIVSRSYVNGFADVLISLSHYGDHYRWLGEVKIAKEPAETVLQQINFYLTYIKNVEAVYILADYDPSDLQRLCAGTKIKVFQLGSRFEQWISSRTRLSTDEL